MKNLNKTFFLIILVLSFLNIFIVHTHAQTIEKQVSEISNELLCPVCRGQTVAESNSDLAKDFRDIIKTKLKEGQTREEILNYFTSRYGVSVLSSPPAEGFRLIIWILPVAVIIIGFLFLGRFLKSESNKYVKNNTGTEDDIYLEEVDEELKKFD